ncbi:MAG: DNA ligase D, partial [Burkholderiales bacterium]
RLDPDDSARPVTLMTRNGNDWTDRFPAIAEALAKLALGACWLDGEAVVLDEQGLPSFQALQNAFETGSGHAIVLYLFDAPFFGGRDVRDLPLSERRARLREALESSVGGVTGPVRWSESFDADPHELLETACSLHLEGIIGKHAQSVYRPGRATSWVKVKCRRRQEFVVGGYTDPSGQRSVFGALLLGVDDDAGALHYAGRVGTGFDRASLDTIGAKLARLRTPTSAFVKLPRAAGVHWVEPVLVAECHFGEWTQDNLLRQASFIALREDKPARTIVRERPTRAADAQADATETALASPEKAGRAGKAEKAGKSETARKAGKGERADPGAAPDTVAGVRISHADRVVDAATGTTKGGLAEYYARVAPAMLPHLRDRPVSLMRAPNGVGGELFFQRHSGAAMPHLTQHPKLDPGHPPLLSIGSLDGLIGAVQMGTVEFHTWNGLVGNLEKPDRIVFDLDPDPSLAWQRMRDAVMLVRTLLDEIGLVSFCKTSGGKGLHVVVPLTPRDGWDAVRDFAQAVARHLAKTLPGQFSAKMGPQNRVGKIFVDYLRNNRGASTVAPFSARARPGLGVSMPVAWDEVPDLKGGDQWNVITAPRRLAELRNDPWANYDSVRQRLSAAMRKRLDGAPDG